MIREPVFILLLLLHAVVSGNPIITRTKKSGRGTDQHMLVPRTSQLGCFYNGHFYAPDTTIAEVREKGSGKCYLILCERTENVLQNDDVDCLTTTKTPTPLIPTPPTRCYYGGHFYAPGDVIDDVSWCWLRVCDSSGHIQMGGQYKPSCYHPTSTPTPPTPTPPNPPTPGMPCYYKSQIYPPNSWLGIGGNYCWGVFCDSSGKIVHEYDFDCLPTPTPTLTTPLKGAFLFNTSAGQSLNLIGK